MRALIAVTLLVAMSLAGCAGDDGGSQDGGKGTPTTSKPAGVPIGEPGEQPAPANGTIQTFDKQYALDVNGVQTDSVNIGMNSQNCVVFTGDNAWGIDNMTASAEWTSTTPASDVLELSIKTPTYTNSISGSSPLAFEVGDIPILAGGEIMTVELNAPDGAAIMQDVTVVIKMDYLGSFGEGAGNC